MAVGRRALLLFSAALILAVQTHAQSSSSGSSVGDGTGVTIISNQGSTPADINLRPFLDPNPKNPTCAVAARVVLSSSFVTAEARAQPTVSPVPSLVLGAINFTVTNLNKTAIKSGWILSVEVPDKVNFTRINQGELEKTVYNKSAGDKQIPLKSLYMNQTLQAGHKNSASIAVLLEAPSQAFTPTSVYLNGVQCSLNLTVNVSALVPGVPIPANFSLAEAAGFISVENGVIVGTDGRPIVLHGLNWFGFDTQSTTVDGIYEGSSTITGDFATVAYRISLLGYNSLRIPFSFQTLFNLQPVSYTRSCTVTSTAAIVENATPPGVTFTNYGSVPPIPAPPQGYGNGICNSYLPNDSVYTRFLYVIRYFAKQGFYVILDNQLNLDPTAVQTPSKWVQLWTQVITDLTSDSITAGHIMVDILNEPDSRNIRWEASNGNLGATALYLNAMDAIYQVSQSTLFLIEGTGQQSSGALCWGDGFVTDQSYLQKFGGSDPSPFFDKLLGRPYLQNVIIAPHYYGPSISKATSDYSGAALVQRATRSWGHLTASPGYCSTSDSSDCYVFPAIIGETGSQVESSQDADFYNTFIAYLKNTGIGKDGQHSAVPHVFWWAWNANSGDTGGIVGDDWLTIQWRKQALLQQINGLTTYAQNAADGTLSTSEQGPIQISPAPQASGTSIPVPTRSPALSNVSAPNLSPSPGTSPSSPSSPGSSPSSPSSPPPSPTAISGGPTSPSSPTYSPVPISPPTPVQVSPTPTPPLAPVNPAAAGASCQYSVGYGGGVWLTPLYTGTPTNNINLYLHASGATSIPSPYTVTVTNTIYTQVTEVWNWNANLGGVNGAITGIVESGTLAPFASNMWNNGFNAVGMSTSQATDFIPTTVSINGVQCQYAQGG
ncbi:hypothetical protein WJX73_008925 [Symbiochloris irregularis]|uniref:Glycoside hydrolase family 5 domain-containing protein n=1 Tax=Symbiochloris irregularis TaxID=706552 RepID=A0AAW1PIV7_9CHLO